MSGFKSFKINDDTLYHDIDESIARQRNEKTPVFDALDTLAKGDCVEVEFSDKFEEEVCRVTNFIRAEQESLQLEVEALLSDANAIIGAVAEKQSSNTSRDSMARSLRSQGHEHIERALNLERFVTKNVQTLSEVASYADGALGTSCLSHLRQVSRSSPWKPCVNPNIFTVLSDVYKVIRTLERQLEHKNEVWEAPSSFVRSTSKYWIKNDNLSQVLLTSLQEVPLLIYGQKGGAEKLDKVASSVSSVYFDSTSMQMYNKRLEHREGAQLLRTRWYGPKPYGSEPIFLELKTHHDKWINTKSVKERVKIQEQDMKAFLERTDWTIEDAEALILAASPSQEGEELEKNADCLLRMHNLVLKFDLRPCVRTNYQRIAFQSSTSNSLRLTVDQNVCVMDERNCKPGSWCLPDDELIDADNTSICKDHCSSFKLEFSSCCVSDDCSSQTCGT